MALNFINSDQRLQIKSLYSSQQFSIDVDSLGVKISQKFNIVMEGFENLLQLRLTDAANQNQVFLCTIDSCAYEQIRIEQSLHVSFHGFIDHLIKILDSCKRSELFISLNKSDNSVLLQFYEKRSFKNLTHLFLPVQEANPEVILYYLNQSLGFTQDQVHTLTNQNKFLQNENHQHEFLIQELNSEIEKLKGKLIENDNIVLHRNTEEVKRLNQQIKQIEENHGFEEGKLKGNIANLTGKLEQMSQEVEYLKKARLQDAQDIEQAKLEMGRMKNNLAASNSDSSRLHQKLNHFTASDKLHKEKIAALNQQIADQIEKLRNADKQKSNLEAELEAEKKICQTKKHALHIATDELANNTETLRLQQQEIDQSRKKIEWRTKVLIRQENEFLKENIKYEKLMHLVNIDKQNLKSKISS